MVADEDWYDSGSFSGIRARFGTLAWWGLGVGVFALIGTLGASLFLGMVAFSAGDLDKASSYASFTSGLATVLLVVLTGWYAIQTGRMVRETRRSREQERQENERQRRREVNSLRQALHEEISKIENLNEFAEDYRTSTSVIGFQVPMTVYRANADKIGLLSEEEADHVVEYYGRVEIIQERMELQRELDTTVGMDVVTEFFERVQAMLDLLLEMVSFGHFGGTGSEKRAEHVSDQIEELAKVQEAALSALEQGLESHRKEQCGNSQE